MVILQEMQQQEKGQLFSFTGEPGGKGKTENHRRDKYVGIGVDIGTTTVVVYLWDFRKGQIFRSLSRENCQTRLGADVMMRIMHSQRGKGQILHQMLVQQIEEMQEELLTLWQKMEDIVLEDNKIMMSVVGNPTMCHFFLNKDVSGLAGAPFQSAYQGNYVCRGADVGFHNRTGIEIQVLSGIAAHVGGDALAAMGAIPLSEKKKMCLLIDLGTNAEIILITQKEKVCCSAAAGPALEGKGISSGVRAKPGAVTGVKLAPKTGNIVLQYLSGRNPLGITGTGILELMEGLCRCGILSEDGYLLSRGEAQKRRIHPDLVKCLSGEEAERSFLLYTGEREIRLCQNDVRNIQLAKGAILAGIQCILDHCGVAPQDLEDVMVAGALGNHLREEAVIRLGLFPSAFRGKLSFVGNAAGMGAVRMLSEPEFAGGLQEKAREISHLELAAYKKFQNYLLQGMEFREY